MRRLSLLLWFVAVGLAHAAVQSPASFHARYDLSVGALKLGTMERTLAVAADGSYHFESHMQTSGLAALFRRERVSETSRGTLVDGRYVPLHYAYDNARKRRHFELTFDHDHGVVRRTNDGAVAWSLPFTGALFDKLVYQAQLMLDLTGAAVDLDYGIADKDALKRYVVRRLGVEEVTTPHGRHSALKLERFQPGSTRRTTVWCAEALGWLPVRVDYQEKDGSVTSAVLRSLSRP